MAVPVALYGSEKWVLLQRDIRKVTSAELKFLRLVKVCMLRERINNAQVKRELQVFKLQDRITGYKDNWFRHFGRMQYDRLP